VQAVAVLPAEQQLGHQAVLDHGRSAPLAGDQRVLVEVPPGVVGQVLRASVGLPRPQHVEGVVVEQRDAARAVGAGAVPAAQAGQEDAVRPAVQRVRPRVAGLARQLLGLDGLVQPGGSGVGPGVVDVDARAAEAGQQQVAALETVAAHVVPLVLQRARAGVPAEVVQLVADGRQVGPPDHAAVPGRLRVDVDHRERIRPLPGAVEGDHVGQLLPRRLDRLTGAAVEGRIHGRRGLAHRVSTPGTPWMSAKVPVVAAAARAAPVVETSMPRRRSRGKASGRAGGGPRGVRGCGRPPW
jgi:hypothetical protein